MVSKQIAALFLLCISSVFGSQVSCPNPSMKAVEGGSVTLPVRVNSTFDWTKERMDVNRADLGDVMVHSYRNAMDHLVLQSAQYGNRTAFSPGLREGNLTISNLSPNDSGSYRFYFPRLKDGCTIILSVVNILNATETPLINTSKPNDGAGTKESLWNTPVLLGVAGVVAVLVLAFVGVYLQRSGKPKIYVSRFRRTQRQEAEAHEMEELNQQPGERAEAAHNAKENGLECVNINNNNC